MNNLESSKKLDFFVFLKEIYFLRRMFIIEAKSFLERGHIVPNVKIKTEKDSDRLIDSMSDTPFKAIIQHPDFRKNLSMIISQVTLYKC